MSAPIRLVISLLIALSSTQAFAIVDLVVKEKLKVYKKPSRSSKVVSTLVRGDKVVISPNSYSGFRKVLVTYNGKRQAGYIPIELIKLSIIVDREKLDGSPMIESHSFGAFGSFSFYSTAGKGTLELEAFPEATLDTASGYKSFFGASYSLPVMRNWVLNLSFANRQFYIKGSGEINPGSTDTIEVTENALSFGGFLKAYGTRTSIFWLGAGLELALVNSVETRVTGSNTALDYSGEMPTYILANVGIGFDVKVHERVFLVPEVRGGASLNFDPMIFYFDAMLGVHYVY